MARQKKRSTNTADHLRPLAKNIIKRALRVYDAAKETFAEAGEQFEDLVHEARTEMQDSRPPKPAKRHKRK